MHNNRKLQNSELNRKSITEFKNSTKLPVSIILDNVRSLHNVGSVFRTSDAFLIEKIFLCGITATPPHKDIHKTALGATETVLWEYEKDTVELVRKLKKENHIIIAIEQAENSKSLQDFTFETEGSTVIIFGNEVKGVQQSVIDECQHVVEIPQFGTKHSLNIATSAGIVIWDIYCKLKAL